MSWCVSPWVYPVRDLLCLLDLIDYFLYHVGEIFNYNLFKNFLILFLFLFFWYPCNLNIGAFDMVPEVSETVLSSFHSFYFKLLFRSYLQLTVFQITDSFLCFRYCAINSFSVQFSCSVVSDSSRPHELQHARAPCPSPTPGVHSDSRPLSQ